MLNDPENSVVDCPFSKTLLSPETRLFTPAMQIELSENELLSATVRIVVSALVLSSVMTIGPVIVLSKLIWIPVERSVNEKSPLGLVKVGNCNCCG